MEKEIELAAHRHASTFGPQSAPYREAGFEAGALSEIAKEIHQPKWVSVMERLPEFGIKVWVLTDDFAYPDNAFSGVYYQDETWHRSGSFLPSHVTHWMPLPTTP